MRLLSQTFLLVMLTWLLAGCFSAESQDANQTAKRFWSAVVSDDMETAKNLTTYESVQYLTYLKSAQINPRRFELGELVIQDYNAELATVLYGGELGTLQIPVRTVLVRTESVWRVDVKKTLGSLISGTMGAVVNELNGLVQEGLKGLDDTMNQTLNDLTQSLNEGMDKLQQDLRVPPPVNQPADESNKKHDQLI